MGMIYWKIHTRTGQELSEGSASWYPGIALGVTRQEIDEISLVTPEGEVALAIHKPCTAFQLKRGAVVLFSGERIVEAHIIGRVNNDQGDCIACIWDEREQKLYRDFHTNVKHFGAWREGVTPPGALSCEAIGVVLDG